MAGSGPMAGLTAMGPGRAGGASAPPGWPSLATAPGGVGLVMARPALHVQDDVGGGLRAADEHLALGGGPGAARMGGGTQPPSGIVPAATGIPGRRCTGRPDWRGVSTGMASGIDSAVPALDRWRQAAVPAGRPVGRSPAPPEIPGGRT